MTDLRNLIGPGLASAMMIAAPGFAAAPASPATTAAKPVTSTVTKQTAAPKTAMARHGAHMTKATLRNGKKVTYDCHLAGNKNKQACKA